jgi:hypothetical protein
MPAVGTAQCVASCPSTEHDATSPTEGDAMTDPQMPLSQPGDPPLEPEAETLELVVANTADGAEVPDTSEGLPQEHGPAEGAPS